MPPILHASAFRRFAPGTLCGIHPHGAVVTRIPARVTCAKCAERLTKLRPEHVAALVRQLDDHYRGKAERIRQLKLREARA